MKHSWGNIKLSEVLSQYREEIWIDDTKVYSQLTNSKYSGIGLRGKKNGADIGRKRQFVVNLDKYPDTITFTRQTIQVDEAIGLCPPEVNGCIVTENMPLFKVENADPKFIEYFFKTKIFLDQLHKTAATGTSQQSIHEDIFLNYEIPFPPLLEQQRIVSKIENVKQRIAQIKKLRTEQTKDINNLLYSKYTDLIEKAEWLPMKEVAPIHRRPVQIQPEETYFEIGVRSFGRGLFEKLSFNGIELTWQQPYWMKEGDLLFSNIKAWEGAVGLIPKKYNGWVGSHRYITCLPNLDLVNPEFLFYYFRTQEGVEKLSSASPGTVDRNRTLNTKKLESISIPVPDITLQHSFVALLHKVNAMKEYYAQTEKELNELMPSLLDKAFKGELITSKATAKIISLPVAGEMEEKAFLKRKILATHIINQSLSDTKFGDVKFEKLLHLSDYFAIKRNFGQKYYQQPAGPYDNAFTHAYFIQIEKAKWFKRKRTGNQFVFSTGESHNKSLNTYNLFTDEELERVNKLITYFSKCDYEQPEIISTLYAVWNNRIIKNEPVTDELLKADFLSWDAQKIKYKDRLEAALQWMRKETIIPDGWGKLIEKSLAKKTKNN
jgi:restriction endonuclease S subunit